MSCDGLIRFPVALSRMLCESPVLKKIFADSKLSSPMTIFLPSITAISVKPLIVTCFFKIISPPSSSICRCVFTKFAPPITLIWLLEPLTEKEEFVSLVSPDSISTILFLPLIINLHDLAKALFTMKVFPLAIFVRFLPRIL